jgi:hypothetical protein
MLLVARHSRLPACRSAVTVRPSLNYRREVYQNDSDRGDVSCFRPYTAGGAHVNFMTEEGQERLQATCGDTIARLVRVSSMHDPTNLFRFNQNIRPDENIATRASKASCPGTRDGVWSAPG